MFKNVILAAFFFYKSEKLKCFSKFLILLSNQVNIFSLKYVILIAIKNIKLNMFVRLLNWKATVSSLKYSKIN